LNAFRARERDKGLALKVSRADPGPCLQRVALWERTDDIVCADRLAMDAGAATGRTSSRASQSTKSPRQFARFATAWFTSNLKTQSSAPVWSSKEIPKKFS
jgi:hypothetical protein